MLRLVSKMEIPILEAYIALCQTVLYDILKRISGSAPVYAVLGNHDTYNQYVVYSCAHPRR